MIDMTSSSISALSEQDLRRQIDRSVSRALVDGDYAHLLLSDPTVVLEDRGCSPQHYKALRGIHAANLLDFATQATAMFWASEPALKPLRQEDQLPLAAAAH
jgi:hypothetical protein